MIRFVYKAHTGTDAADVILNAKLPGHNSNDSGMTNCARNISSKNALVVEVFHLGERVFLFQTGYLRGFIQYIITNREYKRRNLSRKFLRYIFRKYLPDQKVVYTSCFFMATNRKIKIADDDIYEIMFSKLDETRTKELTAKYDCELLKDIYTLT